MTQQTFTDALTEFLDARDNLAHWNQWNTQGIALAHADRLIKAGERLNAMVQPGVALQFGYGPKTHTEDIDYSATAKPVMQYFYRVRGCRAAKVTDADCICWHDEGTGPIFLASPGSAKIMEWREKPAQADESEVRVEEPALQSLTTDQMTRLAGLINEMACTTPSYGPKTGTVMLPRELPEMTKEEAREIGSVCVREFDDGMATCKVISQHDVRQIYSRIVEKFGV